MIERILSYVLGGILGIAGGFLMILFHVPFIDGQNSMFVVTITFFVGVLISVLIVEYYKETALQKNNAIKDETVALITHEMRTGLTSTGWAIQNVLDKYGAHITPDDKRTFQGLLESIHTTIMHSVNLLDISLLDIGKLTISLEWVVLSKLEDMFKETTGKYAIGAKGKGINLTSDIGLDHKREAEVDMVRLRIILENLLENALQYTTRDKKEIQVTITNDEKMLHIVVADTGIGIPQAEQEKIFSEFYRASNARKNMETGSGIGLYTCYQYVQAHHGSIQFHSKENEGSTFSVAIPLKTSVDIDEFVKKI